MKLTKNQVRFLRTLKNRTQPAICKSNPPSPGIQTMVDHGFCLLSKALCGPLAIDTGEVIVSLSPAGETVLELMDLLKEITDGKSIIQPEDLLKKIDISTAGA